MCSPDAATSCVGCPTRASAMRYQMRDTTGLAVTRAFYPDSAARRWRNEPDHDDRYLAVDEPAESVPHEARVLLESASKCRILRDEHAARRRRRAGARDR